MKPTWSFDTKLIHAGEPRPRIAGAITAPIFQSSTFEYDGEGSYHDVRYLRLSNTPSQLALSNKLAALEGGEAAIVTSSGMAAISSTLLSLLQHGDHVIAHRALYGGTHEFIKRDLAKLGIEATLVDADDRAAFAKALRPTTRALYVETMTNPLLEVLDLEGVVEFARAHGLVSIIDNTCATPVNFRPLSLGFDLVLHSASESLNGHSDLVAGAVIGSAERIATVKHKLDHFGGTLDAHACFLLHRGLKTLALRVRHQNETALRVAQFLEKHPNVSRVNYPGLESHPRHGRARKWFTGTSGLLSFEVTGGVTATERFFAKTTLFANAPSLGGTETLATMPAKTSHAGLPPEERKLLGIGDHLIRVSVGLEAAEDLVADLGDALG